MNQTVNICGALSCPYNSPQGCTRYSVAYHCHLAYTGPGKARMGVHPSEYWLYCDDSDWEGLRADLIAAQNHFLTTPKEALRRAQMQRFA